MDNERIKDVFKNTYKLSALLYYTTMLVLNKSFKNISVTTEIHKEKERETRREIESKRKNVTM